MAYATAEELAAALEVRVTPENTQLLEDCLDAAATEIDHVLMDAYDWVLDEIEAGTVPTIVVRTNVNRAVEWWKAPATYNGGVGIAGDQGTLKAPATGFERHTAALLPLRQYWGIA